MVQRKSQTHAEMVRAGLEVQILTGELAPGSILEEGRIAESYNVSRTPVREAINHLVFAGLVEKPARRRAIVCAMDTAKLLELFEVLAELEGLCASFAAVRMTDAEREELQEVHEKAQQILEKDAGNDDYIELGRRFHELIVEGSRNRELIAITDRLGNRLFPYRRYQSTAPGRLKGNQHEHDAVVTAVADGDPDAAREAMRAHAIIQGDLLVRYIALHKVTHADIKRHSTR